MSFVRGEVLKPDLKLQVTNLANLRHPRLVSLIGAEPLPPAPGVRIHAGVVIMGCCWRVQMDRNGERIRI